MLSTQDATVAVAAPVAPIAANGHWMPEALKQRRIMIADDEPINVKLVQKQLSADGYRDFVTTTCSEQVLDLLEERRPDVLILDVVMPGIDGLTLLGEIRRNHLHAHLPVIMVTASNDRETRNRSLDLGATDFLDKPLDPTQLLARVRNALVLKSQFDQLRCLAETLENEVRRRTAELEASRLELLYCLGRAAEFRDNETGQHVIRVGKYVALTAAKMGLDPDMVTLLSQTSQLHDMGKIGIPDSILLKPGKLTAAEMEIMRGHSAIGSDALAPCSPDELQRYMDHTRVGKEIFCAGQSPLLRMAATIAYSHHERWDGTGYPLGLKGEEIPLEGRITAVADVFDALSSPRPYKEAIPIDECFRMIEAERGKHFDPQVVDAFLACKDEVRAIAEQYGEAQAAMAECTSAGCLPSGECPR